MDFIYITLMLVTLARGYFSDLKNGQLGWFIGRIILVTAVYMFLKEIL